MYGVRGWCMTYDERSAGGPWLRERAALRAWGERGKTEY